MGRYVPPPGYERRYGAKDVNEWPSKKVYDEKTPRPTQYYGKGNWMKPTPKPTEYIKTPYAKNVYTKAAIEEQLAIHGGEGEEEGDDRLFSYRIPDGGRCTTPIFGFVNTQCSGGCCQSGRCFSKKKDWANVSYCPAECRGWPFAPQGTC